MVCLNEDQGERLVRVQLSTFFLILIKMYELITLIGIILFPIFTLGCVLIYYGHPILGIVALIVSLISGNYKNK